MNNKLRVFNEIDRHKLVAVLRSSSVESAIKTAEACVKGGIKFIEITFSVPNADDVIKALVSKYRGQDVYIGAGTIIDAYTARIAIVAGACYIVGPTFNAETATLCNRYSIPYIPGCMTINEIQTAAEYGCDMVKLFPANQFSYDYIKTVNAPFPNVRFMVTGGINADNISDWIKAGAVSVGIGGNLTTVKNDNYDAITELAQKYCGIVSQCGGV